MRMRASRRRHMLTVLTGAVEIAFGDSQARQHLSQFGRVVGRLILLRGEPHPRAVCASEVFPPPVIAMRRRWRDAVHRELVARRAQNAIG